MVGLTRQIYNGLLQEATKNDDPLPFNILFNIETPYAMAVTETLLDCIDNGLKCLEKIREVKLGYQESLDKYISR